MSSESKKRKKMYEPLTMEQLQLQSARARGVRLNRCHVNQMVFYTLYVYLANTH